MTLLPEVESALVEAVRRDVIRIRQGHVRRHSRWLEGGVGRRWRPLALIVILALGGATAALAAAGVFQTGAPLEPGAPVLPTVANGVAIAGSARLLLRVPDPHGGLPWSVRVLRTTRGETCVQVGRRAFGAIGVLGQDGAFSDDARFHPISENYENALSCTNTDAGGHAFVSLVLSNVPASAYDAGCRLPLAALPAATRAFLQAHPLFAKARAAAHARRTHQPVCPPADLRDVLYGLLGPDATTITYVAADGQLASARTAGTDGAYLIVLPESASTRLCAPQSPLCPLETMSNGSSAPVNGEIRAIDYRDHASCVFQPSLPPGQQSPCANVGYVAPHGSSPPPAQVTSAITVRGDRPQHGQAEVTVSFASPVAITNTGDY
jgi:hypothetical protein